jgi:hypothetical protein
MRFNALTLDSWPKVHNSSFCALAERLLSNSFRKYLKTAVFFLFSLVLSSCSNPLGSNSSVQPSFLISPSTYLACPAGYVLVPYNSAYTSADFCVSKYIISQNGSVAASVPGVAPWVSISQTAAETACQALGSRYDLISNAEWQTVAQNIELVAANWSGATVGSAGGLSVGISNGDMSSAQPASSDDTQGCYNTYSLVQAVNQSHCTTNWDSQRRTSTLSNGNIIWDMSGNVFQWMKDSNNTNFGVSTYTSQITSASNPTIGTIGSLTGTSTFLFGPSGNYTALNSGAFGGLGYGSYGAPPSPGAILRGGFWGSGGWPGVGVFAVFLLNGPSLVDSDNGFRCVYH